MADILMDMMPLLDKTYDIGFWTIPTALCLLLFLAFMAKRSKNGGMQWLGRTLFPLLLLLYIWIPINFATGMLWLLAYSLAVVSVISIALRVLKYLIHYLRGMQPTASSLGISLVAPILTIAAVYTAYTVVHRSIASANRYALTLAIEEKPYLDKAGHCRMTVPGFTEHSDMKDGAMRILYGRYGTQYPIIYHCDPEFQAFRFQVDINRDTTFDITAKPNKPLTVTYGPYGNPTALTLNDDTDLDALSHQKHPR